MRKLLMFVLVMFLVIYFQSIQTNFTKAQDFTQPIPTAQITIQPATWFNEFFTYPNSSSVNTGFNPLYVHEVSQNTALVQYMLKTSDSQDTVIQWYTDHASDYGFVATTDPVGPMTTSMLSSQGADPTLIKSVIVYHAIRTNVCTGFIIGAYPITVSPGNIMLATPVSSPSVLQEFPCTAIQTTPTVFPTPTVKLSPTLKQITPTLTPTPISPCTINPDDLEQIQRIKEQMQTNFGISIDEQNKLCGMAQCQWQNPLNATDLDQIRTLIMDLPESFRSKLNGMDVRGPSSHTILNLEQQICCISNNLGSWNFYDNSVIICGSNGIHSSVNAGAAQVLSHEMVHYWQNNFPSSIPPEVPNRAYMNPFVVAWINNMGWLPPGASPAVPHCFPVIGCQGTVTPADVPAGYNMDRLNPLEDMAHSVQVYINNPEELKTVSPRRYEFIKTLMMDGKEY